MEKEEELFIPKTKYKGIKILLGIIIIAGLIVGGYFFYQYKFNNPKTIVNSILDTAKENINGNVVVDTKNALYKVDGHIKVDTNIDTKASEEINLLKDIEILFNGEIDPNNSISNININTK